MTSARRRHSARLPANDLIAPDEEGVPPRRIANTIRLGFCPAEGAFDRFLPPELQAVSEHHWTPLVAAMRAAQWLDEMNVRTVLDIGSGAGKFCVAAALASECRFIGLEQRAHLVSAARDLARVFKVDSRVAFINGTLEQTRLPETDAYYLYNPFGENLFGPADQIDDEVELGEGRYHRNVSTIESLLDEAPMGTYVLTYNGFGGDIPVSYRQLRSDHELPSVLRMWRKTRLWSTSPA